MDGGSRSQFRPQTADSGWLTGRANATSPVGFPQIMLRDPAGNLLEINAERSDL